MKEIITEITIKATNVMRVPDNQVDEIIAQDQDAENQRKFAEVLKKKWGMDNVTVQGVKQFINDVPDEKKVNEHEGSDDKG